MFFSASVSCFAYKSIRAHQINFNINDQVALGPSNQIFSIQFKVIIHIHDKTKISQSKYSSDYLLPKILLEAIFLASSTWAKSPTKF